MVHDGNAQIRCLILSNLRTSHHTVSPLSQEEVYAPASECLDRLVPDRFSIKGSAFSKHIEQMVYQGNVTKDGLIYIEYTY